MDAFVINLEGAKERWDSIQATFAATGFAVVRVPAVNGLELEMPVAGFSEGRFQRRHGRSTNLREVGCYLSHVEACRAFLQTDGDAALICEDDIQAGPDLEPIVRALLSYGSEWDLVRLSGLSEGKAVRVRELPRNACLVINFGRLKGAGAYLVNRAAARAIGERFLPMRLPFDHAIDREWFYGLRAFSVLPFPISQTETGFRSQIQRGPSHKLSQAWRWLWVYPYQAYNEITRWLHRGLMWLRIRSRGKRS